ncbi:hypothetical protein S7711_09762 [Stachybotrys chartarum IBT 7711]|uniref:BZIP domain-containing protein n=1 Tax=Stachybotrys chartarum (strain CBS 109288 / IBT 7711) TaxID=1280523 RepID=A0A084B520_STACB|nr:hypothetical protein S7711_09762 [Stachybotrys chartarum IBT 7711]
MRSSKTPPQPTDSSSIPTSTKRSPPSIPAEKIHHKERKSQKQQQPIKHNKGTRRITFLERNRQAASKCRQKKKEQMHKLEETNYDLEMRHSDLQKEYDRLLADVIELKNLLISHACCNDANIDSWIEGEARKILQKSLGRVSI